MNKKQILAGSAAAAVSLLVAIPAFAAAETTPARPGIIGSVSAVDGSTFTVKDRKGSSYTIDASGASVTKGFGKSASAIALSSVSMGDMIAVKGTVDGTSVAATAIADLGLPHLASAKQGEAHAFMGRPAGMRKATFGTIASVDGSSFTLTEKRAKAAATVSVSTDSSTAFKKDGVAASASDLADGQTVIVAGTKSADGTSIAATSVNIMTKKPAMKGRQKPSIAGN